MDPQQESRQVQTKEEYQQTTEQADFIENRYKIYPELDWKTQDFDPRASMKRIQTITEYQDLQNNSNQSNIFIDVVEASQQGSGITKYVAYVIKGKNKNQEFEILRRYKQFDLLHEKLTLRWPGCYIPSIPNKTLVGNTDKQVTANRMRFLKSFLKKIASVPQIYYGEQFQAFLTDPQELVEKNLQVFKQLSYQDILDKYRTCFPQLCKQSIEEIDIENFFETASVLRNKKLDLNKSKIQLRRLAELRDKYIVKEQLLLSKLLPEFETTCLEWWDNQTMNKDEPHQKLFTSQKFTSEVQLLMKQRAETNPFWLFFDILKFELREIDALIVAIQHARKVLTQKKYLERTIGINKEQIQSLNQNKTTLKTFLMGGTQDQKRTNLALESQACEAKLATINQLYAIIATIGIKSVQQFHHQRSQFYKTTFGKVMKEELKAVKALMNFYIGQTEQ